MNSLQPTVFRMVSQARLRPRDVHRRNLPSSIPSNTRSSFWERWPACAATLAPLARHARRDRRVSRWGKDLQADGADAGSGETVLVRHDLRSAQSQRNSDRPRQSGVAFAVRVEGQDRFIPGFVFRPTAPAGHEGEWIKTIPAKGGSSTSASTAPRRPSLTEAGSRGDFELVK
jgi:hypothetical protein